MTEKEICQATIDTTEISPGSSLYVGSMSCELCPFKKNSLGLGQISQGKARESMEHYKIENCPALLKARKKEEFPVAG